MDTQQSIVPSNPNGKNGATENLRINKAFQLAIVGLILAALLVLFLVLKGAEVKNATDITAIVGLFTSVLGTIIGAFFGVQIGSADKHKAEERADNVQQKFNALQQAADEKTIDRARSLYPGLFK